MTSKVFGSSHVFKDTLKKQLQRSSGFSHVTDSRLALAIHGFLCDATGGLKEIGRVVHGDLLRDRVLPVGQQGTHRDVPWIRQESLWIGRLQV